MPEWLLKSEDYSPQRDKDSFLDKSILSLFSLIAKIRAQDVNGRGMFGVDAFFQLIFTLALIVFVSLAREFAFLFAALTYVLLELCVMPSGAMKSVLKVSLIMAAFSVIVLLPSAFFGSAYSLTIIPVQAFISVSLANILSHSSRWREIIGALKRFRVPDIFVFMLDFTVKYIVMLGEYSLESVRALKLRSVGRSRGKYTSLSGVAGNIFLKSREMARDSHGAMVCRGFTGEYTVGGRLTFGVADAIYIVVNAGVIALYFYLHRG
jgi:cobalt/nickel transport system permease protein